ncbi:MAG: hypothetical protein H6739_03650 [Alphaproteobacteria bacterium]|nr:hypothetical protein [Alphaproteobacteria bacterium]
MEPAPREVLPDHRPLTEDELRYVWDLYCESVDFAAVRLARESLLSVGPPKVVGNTVHMPSTWGGQPLFDGSNRLTHAGLRILVHELGHVWQYQNGGMAYIPESLWAQARSMMLGDGRKGAYVWQNAYNESVPWAQWNPEQQATAIEHYDAARRRIGAGEADSGDHQITQALLPVIEKVRRGEGAPHFSKAGATFGGVVMAVVFGGMISLLMGPVYGLSAALIAAALGVYIGGC